VRGRFDQCQHGAMTASTGRLRTANIDDSATLLHIWALLFDGVDTTPEELWRGHALEWLARFVDDADHARFPVIEVNGDIVATAIGTLELGVPNLRHGPRRSPGESDHSARAPLPRVRDEAGARRRGLGQVHRRRPR